MPRKPERPFVPHHTPMTARAPIAASEFRLYRPFLPGGEREAGEPVALGHAVAGGQEQSEHARSLRPIGDFLDASQKVGDHQRAAGDPYTSEADEEPDELPPVEHFLDPLPPVDRFAPAPDAGPSDAWPAAGDDPASRETRPRDPLEAAGWGETDWQHYDWRSAAALGESGVDEATTEWAATDWDGTGHRPREPRQSAANAIATALDEIARRIREGDLSSSGPGPMTDPATIAATLAALLGVRR